MADGAEELRVLLAQVAASGVAAERAYIAETPEDAQGFVLDALRCCILPREVSFLIDDTPALRVAAAGGRVLCVLDCADDAAADLAGRALDPGSQGDTDRVAELLQTLFQGEERITVRSAPLPTPVQDGEAGLGAAALAEALALVRVASDPDSRLDSLLSAAEDVLIASYTPGGDIVMYRDGIELPEEVFLRLDRDLSGAGLMAQVAQDEILFLPAQDNATELEIALVHGAEGPAALIFDPGSAADVARFWTDLPLMTTRSD